jgi:hypothetical protein
MHSFQSAFEHIEQVNYLLVRLLESGFDSVCAATEEELRELAAQAQELGLIGGGRLLGDLSARLNTFRAGQGGADTAADTYSRLVAYYSMVRNTLILERI